MHFKMTKKVYIYRDKGFDANDISVDSTEYIAPDNIYFRITSTIVGNKKIKRKDAMTQSFHYELFAIQSQHFLFVSYSIC